LAWDSPVGIAFSEYDKNSSGLDLTSKHLFTEVDLRKDPFSKAMTLMTLFLIYEKFERESQSFFAPYLFTLPTEFDLPYWWDEDQLESNLVGTNLYFIVKERKNVLKENFDKAVIACGHIFLKRSLTW